ncbi:MAG: hypothetical protein LBQ24_02070 [Candidatus Peribacteria bacterium]|nr:hypothetical protein [Candidatus Peribacteria bacterium]
MENSEISAARFLSKCLKLYFEKISTISSHSSKQKPLSSEKTFLKTSSHFNFREKA